MAARGKGEPRREGVGGARGMVTSLGEGAKTKISDIS
jgi:hypothetical protein